MPWCPKCRNEYKKGIFVCADCNTELTEELEPVSDFTTIANLKNEEHTDKLIEFLQSENIETVKEYSKDDDSFIISVHEKDVKIGKKLFNAFYTVEMEEMIKETFEEQTSEGKDISEHITEYESDDNNLYEDETDNDSKLIYSASIPYIKKSEKSKDLKSTAVTFIFFGVVGIIFIIINILGIVTLFNNILSYIVMSIMFIGCLYMGLISLRDSKKADKDAVLEEELTREINKWLEEHISDDIINSFEDPDNSEEINYLSKIESIKKLTTDTFGEIDEAYLDSVVEDFYNAKFEYGNNK